MSNVPGHAPPQQQAQAPQQQQQHPGHAQLHAALFGNLPQLIKMTREGHITDAQLTQLKNLTGTFLRTGGMAALPPAQAVGLQHLVQAIAALTSTRMANAAQASGQPPAQMPQQPQQPPQPVPQQQPQQPPQPPPTQPAAAPSQAQQQQAMPPPANPPQAAQPQVGQKRKSPMPEGGVPTINPIHAIASAALASGGSNTAAMFPVTQNLSVIPPGLQPWPNTVGPRPTLSQGLATGSSILGLPTHVLKGADDDALTALTEGFKKDTAAAGGEHQLRRTIKDLVASIDPNVKVDSETEDILLQMADEFIDSVTKFACRLAQHRGSDVVDVKDLQLHLERNHNIRIPGFSSDETRLAISHSNPATGGMATKAAKVEAKPKGPDDKDKAAKDGKKSKSSKAKEPQSGGAATRAARLAAVRGLK